MTIYSEDQDGEILILFDSRWQFPETLGYKPTDPEYAELQKLWEEATGENISENALLDEAAEVPLPAD